MKLAKSTVQRLKPDLPLAEDWQDRRNIQVKSHVGKEETDRLEWLFDELVHYGANSVEIVHSPLPGHLRKSVSQVAAYCYPPEDMDYALATSHLHIFEKDFAHRLGGRNVVVVKRPESSGGLVIITDDGADKVLRKLSKAAGSGLDESATVVSHLTSPLDIRAKWMIDPLLDLEPSRVEVVLRTPGIECHNTAVDLSSIYGYGNVDYTLKSFREEDHVYSRAWSEAVPGKNVVLIVGEQAQSGSVIITDDSAEKVLRRLSRATTNSDLSESAVQTRTAGKTAIIDHTGGKVTSRMLRAMTNMASYEPASIDFNFWPANWLEMKPGSLTNSLLKLYGDDNVVSIYTDHALRREIACLDREIGGLIGKRLVVLGNPWLPSDVMMCIATDDSSEKVLRKLTKDWSVNEESTSVARSMIAEETTSDEPKPRSRLAHYGRLLTVEGASKVDWVLTDYSIFSLAERVRDAYQGSPKARLSLEFVPDAKFLAAVANGSRLVGVAPSDHDHDWGYFIVTSDSSDKVARKLAAVKEDHEP